MVASVAAGDEVAFLQEVFVPGILEPPFDPADAYRHVDDYQRDEALEVSEWRVPVDAIRDFLGSW
jgi:hypothetical protein